MRKSLLILFIFLLFTTAVQANEITSSEDNVAKLKEEIKVEILEKYKDDEQFQLEYKISPKSAMEMIDRFVDKEYDKKYIIDPEVIEGGYGYIAYCTVPVIKQKNDYYCGYATMLQTLYGIGKAGSVSGLNDDAKQTTLAINAGHQYSSAIVWEVKRDLNTYISSDYYNYQKGADLTQYEFTLEIFYSLLNDRPVLLHARTGSLSYYGGTNLGHYLSLDRIDGYNDIVTIKDCNWYDVYRGEWKVPTYEAYGTVTPTDRYLITN